MVFIIAAILIDRVLYSGSTWFESQPGRWSRFVDFFISPRQRPGECLNYANIPKTTTGVELISYRGALLSTLLHATA
jgi:hypothetical protein